MASLQDLTVARRSIARRNLSPYNPFNRPPRKRADNIKIALAPLGGGSGGTDVNSASSRSGDFTRSACQSAFA
jgi:hypothetical protein